MPGPKMGARPADFDEKLVRESPTFKKWERLTDGYKLRYACRDFIKGHGDDEERLMRRIMIARRNNLRDHEILKQARAQVEIAENNNNTNNGASGGVGGASGRGSASNSQSVSSKRARDTKGKTATLNNTSSNNSTTNTNTNTTNTIDPTTTAAPTTTTKRRRCATSHSMTDDELRREMDTPAIEATRSYKAWLALPDGEGFTYNQKYEKGREGHDWLLRKNIWRRMRYRRHNKSMVEKLKSEIVGSGSGHGNGNGAVSVSGGSGSNGNGNGVVDNSNTNNNSMSMPIGMPAVPGLSTVPDDPNTNTNTVRVHVPLQVPLQVSLPDAYNTCSTTVNVNVNEAAVTATQIVDHSLLATASAAAASASTTTPPSAVSATTTSAAAADGTMPEHTNTITNTHTHSHTHTHNNSSEEENLHAAVVEAAVAAVAAAESYVNQARESEVMTATAAAYDDVQNMGTCMDMNVNGTIEDHHHHHHNHHHQQQQEHHSDSVSGVHNPIISDQDSDALDHNNNNNTNNNHHHDHTPNPLVNFDGDALDVAAKLAAAASASVQVCEVDDGNPIMSI